MDTHQNHLQRRRNCTLTTETKFNGKSINTNAEKDQRCIKEILTPIHAHLTDMLENHNKVMAVRFDLRTPQGTKDLINKDISRIFENMKRALDRKEYAGGHDPDLRLIGVKEDNGNGAHYHCLALVNANAIQNQYTIHKAARKYLGKALGLSEEETQGLVHNCNTNGKNGTIIKRGSTDEQKNIDEVMYQTSYLAKEKSKENTPKGQHLWVGTRVPKKENKNNKIK